MAGSVNCAEVVVRLLDPAGPGVLTVWSVVEQPGTHGLGLDIICEQ
jgi:hypothetical protein